MKKSTLLWGIVLVICLSCSSAKKTEEERHEEANEVHLKPEVLANLNVKMEEARLQPLYEEIAATGRVIQDPEDVSFVFSPVSGIVRTIEVQVGSKVKKGQHLIGVGGQVLRAPREGTVISINTTVGSRVGTLQSLIAIADIDPIRVVFDVYPKDMDRIAAGQQVEVTLIGHAEHTFTGTLVYLSPRLDPVSQTFRVGADVTNTDQHLKFGMFVQGRILTRVEKEILAVPEEAVVRFDRDFAVFVPGDEEGSFIKRPVRPGQRGSGRVEILEGLEKGEKVVTRGSFTLKSELMKGSLGED